MVASGTLSNKAISFSEALWPKVGPSPLPHSFTFNLEDYSTCLLAVSFLWCGVVTVKLI